ncbi:MAG: tetratricopeptide repeat protein, partial [Candidatus Peribacteraceae bacterium]|nr:tetratricopeptide repeat protein [Candidatus Peribacteraceae bacterium]
LCDAIKMFESSNARHELATTYSCVGIYYNMIKNYPKAMEYCFRAIELFNSLKNQEGLANSYSALGQIYQNSNDATQSEIMHNNALSIYVSLNSFSGMAISHVKLGFLCCSSKDRYQECINHFKEAVKIYSKLGIPYSMGKCLGLMGMLSYGLNKDDEAHQYLADALQYLKSFNT